MFLFIFLFLIFLFYFLCKFKAGRLFCNMCIDEWVGIWFVLVNFAVFVLLLSFIDFRVFFCFFIDVIRFRGIRDWYRCFFCTEVPCRIVLPGTSLLFPFCTRHTRHDFFVHEVHVVSCHVTFCFCARNVRYFFWLRLYRCI